MLPQGKVSDSSSDNGIIKSKKKVQMKQKEDVSKNITIMEGSISKFLNKHNNLVKRYLVLNQYGFFVYKDEQAFKNSP